MRRGRPGEPTEADLLNLRYQAKAALRGKIVALRRRLPPEARARRSDSITQRVLQLPIWSSARTVAAYVAVGGEVDPNGLIEACHSSDKHVCLPRIDPDGSDMRFHAWPPHASLERSELGFRQPSPDSPRVEENAIDVVLVPAVAADSRGYRLGRGKGYYDRHLPLLSSASRVALVFDFQVLAELPETPGDVPMHWVVSDRATWSISPT